MKPLRQLLCGAFRQLQHEATVPAVTRSSSINFSMELLYQLHRETTAPAVGFECLRRGRCPLG
eukprot:3656359-Pleurochrysis_carterae.AAC.1